VQQKARVEQEIKNNSDDKSTEMDKVKSAEVELNTLTQIEIEKTNVINENKEENKAMYKTLERSKRIFLEMKNLNLKKIKDLEEIIQTATFDIQI